jgi:ribosomal protein S18 acetylase RimI-like enzyme
MNENESEVEIVGSSKVKKSGTDQKTLDDSMLDELVAIEKQSFEQGIAYNRQHLRRVIHTKPNRTFYIANEQGTIMGYILFREEVQCFRIICIAVHPNFRKNGIGTKLMSIAMRQLESSSKKNIELECRPLNESFYLKLGFKTIDSPISNYYSAIKTNAVKMQYTHQSISHEVSNENKIVKTDKSNFTKNTDIDLLIEFAGEIKWGTSFWYGSVLVVLARSQRKESAFECIIKELQALKIGNIHDPSKINMENVLRAIIHNACIIRGKGNDDAKTSSGNTALKLLNTDKFSQLKDIILSEEREEQVQYNHLIEFAEYPIQDFKTSDLTQAPVSPYSHFVKL